VSPRYSGSVVVSLEYSLKQETVCGLDIGTTKTCAVVAVDGPNGLEIIGVGETPSPACVRVSRGSRGNDQVD